jgi:hypothetical protein
LQEFFLDEFEELFGLGEGQAEMLNAVAVFFQRHDISYGFFTAIIAAQDELEFDAHGWAPPGGMGGGMNWPILLENLQLPQHLHALPAAYAWLQGTLWRHERIRTALSDVGLWPARIDSGDG